MEEVLLRFPHLGDRIFKILSNNGLIQCKMVSKTWYHFITNEKFYKHWKDIFRVVKKLSPVNFVVQHTLTNKSMQVHANRLRPIHTVDTQFWNNSKLSGLFPLSFCSETW